MPSDVLPKRGKKLRNGFRDFFKLNWKHQDKTQGRRGRNLPPSGTGQNEKQARAPARIDMNQDDPEGTRRVGRTGVLLQSEHSPSKTWPLSGRADNVDSATQEQLNEAQHHQPAFDPPPPKPRLTRTWDTIRSASGASVRTVASGLRKLVCIEPDLSGIDKRKNPKLPRSRSDLPSSRRRRERGATGFDSDLDCLQEKSLAERARTFPTKIMDPPSPDFEDLKRDLHLRAQTTEVFNEIWEDQALPHLRSVMQENSFTEYSIAVEFNYDFNHRIVEVTTPKKFPEGAKSAVTEKIDAMFKSATLYVEVQFVQGVDERSSNSAGDSDEDRDWNDPTNGTDYLGPPSSDTPAHPGRLLNGDSIDREDGHSAATLGPAIQLDNERIVWLVSGHVFEGVQALDRSDPGLALPECYLVHPGNLDRRPGREVKRVAKLYAHSGPMCRTQRQSRSMAKFAPKIRREDAWVVTDWALCVPEKDQIRLLNHLRYAPRGREFQDCSGLVDAPFPTNPKLRLVRSSGRSSGIRWSVVCETPAEVKHADQPPTREWYLEIIRGKNSPLRVDQWNSGGPGMPGDSGALIVDDETRKLIGIIWGRSRREDDGKPRRAYFTHGCDVFDDIYSRCDDIANYPRLVGQTDGSMDLQERPPNLPRNYDPRDFANGGGERPTLSSTSRRCGASEVTECASRESMALTACGSSDGGVSIPGGRDSGYHANAMSEKAADYLIVPQVRRVDSTT